jgi:hypothetical protein
MTISQTLPQVATVDSFTYECNKQQKLKEQLESEGFTLAEDPAGLYDKIGTVTNVECFCELYTPRLLVKLFGSNLKHLEHAFWLVPLWQIVKYGYILPQPGQTFSMPFVIGVRKVSDSTFVPSLRLPLQ